MIDGIRIFDAHAHFTGKFMKKDETLIDFLNRYGIDKAIITTLNTSANSKLLIDTDETMDDQEYANNFYPHNQYNHEEVRHLVVNNPERLYGFYWFNPKIATDTDWRVLDDYITKYDFKGVKTQITLDNLSILKDFDDLASFCIDHQVPIYYHSGLHFFFQKPLEIKNLHQFLDKHRDLKFIIGHAAFTMEYLISVLRYFRNLENVYFETSLSVPYGINVLIKVMGKEKVIFGSDSPAATPPDIEIQKIKSLNLKPGVEKLIFYENVSNLIGV